MGDRQVHFRRTVQGRLDMGWPQIPPLPARIGLVDRGSGTTYYLGTAGAYPALTLVLTTTPVVDRVAGVYVYGAFDGPVVDDWRLFVSGGNLATEPAPGLSQTRVYARSDNTGRALRVTAPGGVLTYTNIAL